MLAHIAPSVISEQIRIVSQSPNFVRNTVSRRQFYEMAAKFALHEIQCGTVILVLMTSK